MTSIFAVRDLEKSFGGVVAAKNITVTVEAGETVGIIGANGAGKTTTCAKLALHLRDKHGKRPLLVAADIKRPAAVEQLRALGERIQIPVFHKEGVAPPDVCAAGLPAAEAGGQDVVILDTAVRPHRCPAAGVADDVYAGGLRKGRM